MGFCSAPPTQRQGRAIHGREAHRARTRARRAAKRGQFSGTCNEPMFAAIGARGAAPRRLQCDRDADATAGSRHTRPRGSQGAHAGARGGTMQAILLRIQRAYFRRYRRAVSRATKVAVRSRPCVTCDLSCFS